MRDYLKPGTRIRVSGNIIYTITGEPIGEGGGSVIYPALRSIPDGGGYRTGSIRYAVKECYPESGRFEFTRSAAGEVRPCDEKPEAAEYLERLKAMQREEGDISGKIYQNAFRLTPITEAYSHIELSFGDSDDFHPAANQISIMELLSDKGESLRRCLRERKRLNVHEAFEVIRQVLFAVDEVHRAGYLHLDIQDGNVFIKGVLDRKDNMITLIDFGAARPVLSDGLCAEITDRVIYSTRGFSAPEILFHNDGHLRLGREADLYSIGCLLLVLLTGHRYTTQELTANSTGRYIPAFAVRKTGCPGHLVRKMQDILAKALRNDPSVRYGSAEEMLADVDEMRKLLAPHVDPLSAAEFDAFICYAHGEKENAAAAALRDSLERYRDSAFGERKIRRVFLDEGELSSCADYGESINAALKNSRWLIVLLSERAKESRWVGEEIKTFLAHHDKSKVLAVLLEGEPSEVFPEALTRSGLTADNLLAADARAEDRKRSIPAEDSRQNDLRQITGKIKGDVTLRIAAPILGTTYESLKQRVRIYRMKRAFAAAVVTLCALAGFLGYAAVKANKIAEQERQIAGQQSLIAEQARKEADLQKDRQAELLAAQAQDFYDKKDYTKAAESALDSLELTEKGCRRRSALKKILIECLNLYVQPEEARYSVVPTGVFREETGVSPERCFLNSDGSRLFMVCGRRVSVWDTSDRRMISAFDSGAELSEKMCAGRESLLNEKDGQLIIWSDRELVCFGYETGEVAWRKEFEGEKLGQVLVQPERGIVLDMFRSGQSGQAVVEERNITDGELRGEHVFDSGGLNRPFGFACDLSDDGRYIACLCTAAGGQTEMVLRIYDLSDNILTESEPEEIDPWGSYRTEDVMFAGGGRVLASKYDGPANIRSYADDEHYADRVGAKNFRISCYDVRDGGKVWSYAESDTDLRGLWESRIMPVEVDGVSAVAAAVGNTVLILDTEGGGCLLKMQLDSAVTYWDRTEEGLRFVLSSGEILYVPETLDMKEALSARNLPADAGVMCADGSCLYVAGDAERGTVIRYERGRADDSYAEEAADSGAAAADSGAAAFAEMPGDEQVTEWKFAPENEEGDGPGSIEIGICEDGESFEIRADEVRQVNTGRKILALSLVPGLTPEGAGIFAGFEDKVRLYGCSGTLIGEAELPRPLIYKEPGKARLYFPEKDALCYTDSSIGYLIDVYDDGIDVVRSVKNVAGFDHDKGELILRIWNDRGGFSGGRLSYRTLDEIRRLASLWCQAP